MCGHHHGAVSDGDMVVNGSTADHTCGIGAVSSHMCRLRTCSPLHFSTYLKETTRLIGGICFSSGARLGLAMCSAHSEEHESISHAASTHQTRAAPRRTCSWCAQFRVARSSSITLARIRMSQNPPAPDPHTRDPHASND